MGPLQQLESDDVGESGYPVPLGAYLLLERLAKGGMGEVHLAKHGGLAGIEKYCVVKTLKREALLDDEAVRRFMDEARVVVNLAHRNICPVFDVGRADERYYLAMEYVAGRDLKAVTERASELGVVIPPGIALHLVCEVLEALDYAHRLTHPSSGQALHLVHRDVSPANVMVSAEGEVKLIDFGLALSRVKEQRTEPHMVMGKLAYMAPEQLACEPLDKRTDLFAAAVMLYELLTSARFYGELTDGGIVHAAASGSYAPPLLATLDDELQGILGAGLHADRERRPADCAALREQLVRYQLKREMSAGSRAVRELMEQLFPDERARVRALYARFANVSGLPRAEPSQAAPPALSATSEPATVLPLRPAASGPVPVSAADIGLEPVTVRLETFKSFDTFENSNPSTPVGRVRLAKVRAADAKPGTPRAELQEPPEATALEDGDGGFDEPTQVVERAAARRRGRRSSPLSWVAGSVALASVAAALVLVTSASTGGTDPVPPAAFAAREEPSTLVSAAPVAAQLDPRPAEPTTIAAPPDDEGPGLRAEVDGTAPLLEAAEAEPAVKEDTTATSGLEPREEEPRPPPRRIQKRRRSAPRALTPPGPKAKAEHKIRYLDRACRQKAPCAGALVDMFRGMRVDDARTFWPRVDACVRRCGQ